MKQYIYLFILLFIASSFVGCKKEEAKKTEDQTQLEEVEISEKVHYLHKLEWIAYKTPDKIYEIFCSCHSVKIIDAACYVLKKNLP